MQPRRSAFLLTIVLLQWAGSPTSTIAQTEGGTESEAEAPSAPVDEAVAAYEGGEFERADELLNQAMASATLSREQVVRILTHQVLVSRALGNEETLDAAALRLVSLEPDALSAQAPPDLEAHLAAARDRGQGLLRVEVVHQQRPDGVQVEARVVGDAGGLVRTIELGARTAGPWSIDPVSTVFVEDARAAEVEVFARATGPGGSVLAHHGSEDAPEALVTPVPAAALVADPEPSDEDGGKGVLWGVLIGGGVLAVAAAVLIGVLVARSGPDDGEAGSLGVEW